MVEAIQSEHSALKYPDTRFIFGGYSWEQKRFLLWEIFYARKAKAFEVRPARCPAYSERANRFEFYRSKKRCREAGNLIAFGGDMAGEARRRLLHILGRKREEGKATEPFQFNMEPFEVVRDMLHKSRKDDSIGGAPQPVRIDQYINARAVGVYWPNRDSGQVTLLGRPALGYENLDAWVLDPESLKLHHPHYNPVKENLDGTLAHEE